MVTNAMSSGVKLFHSVELGLAPAPRQQQMVELQRMISCAPLGTATSPEELSVGGPRKPTPRPGSALGSRAKQMSPSHLCTKAEGK